MAGMPRTRALARALDRRVAKTFDLPEDIDDEAVQVPSHLDYVCLWVSSGKTMLELVKDLNASEGLNLMPAMLGNYLRRYWPDATARLDAAREEGSDYLGERSVEVGDERADTSADVGRLRVKASALQWLAGGWNRAKYGQGSKANVAVTVNMAEVHLDALRARSIDRGKMQYLGQAEVLQNATPAKLAAPLPERQYEVTSSDSIQSLE
jgi:hypothetical protein